MACSQYLWQSRGADQKLTQESSLVIVAGGRRSKTVGRARGSKSKSEQVLVAGARSYSHNSDDRRRRRLEQVHVVIDNVNSGRSEQLEPIEPVAHATVDNQDGPGLVM